MSHPSEYPDAESDGKRPSDPQPAKFVMAGTSNCCAVNPCAPSSGRALRNRTDGARQRRTLSFHMPDVHHTFRRGHRIMVQVQSSWFPLTDLNPQKFMRIPEAKPEDFQKATQRVYWGAGMPPASN